MISLAGEMFDAVIVKTDTTFEPSRIDKVSSVLKPRMREKTGDEICLLVCKGPSDLYALLDVEDWRKRFRYVAAWVIDSFWLDHIPKYFRLRNPFDRIFVTSLEDVERYEQLGLRSTTWLPWGSDVLRLGRGGTRREWDVTRVGRQPPEWDNDAEAGAAAGSLGIRYRGRPDSTGLTVLENQKLIMSAYAATKFILAFSNAVNRDPNNHPTREYLTGRWVDALSCGATVAGIAPRGPNTDRLLWPGATLELGSVRRAEGLQIIAAALRQWTPERAAANNALALQRLDWRWRFKEIADVFGLRPSRLILELESLDERIAQVSSARARIPESA
jgi:hypothetical protein